MGLSQVHIVHLVLTSRKHPHPTDADAHRVHDTVWTHAVPADGLEHLRAACAPGRIDLVLFLRSPGQPAPPIGPALGTLTRLVAPLADWQAALAIGP